jgi:uncharacterized protein YkwD
MKKLLVLLVLLVSGLGYSQTWKEGYPSVPSYARKTLEKDSVWWSTYVVDSLKARTAILNEINRVRKENGKPIVKMGTEKQTNSTQSYTNYESENHMIGHDSDLWGEDVVTEVSASNGGFTVRYFKVDGDETYNEIAKALINQWMGSAGHKKEILGTDFTTVSIGICLRHDGVEGWNTLVVTSSVRGH